MYSLAAGFDGSKLKVGVCHVNVSGNEITGIYQGPNPDTTLNVIKVTVSLNEKNEKQLTFDINPATAIPPPGAVVPNVGWYAQMRGNEVISVQATPDNYFTHAITAVTQDPSTPNKYNLELKDASGQQLTTKATGPKHKGITLTPNEQQQQAEAVATFINDSKQEVGLPTTSTAAPIKAIAIGSKGNGINGFFELDETGKLEVTRVNTYLGKVQVKDETSKPTTLKLPPQQPQVVPPNAAAAATSSTTALVDEAIKTINMMFSLQGNNVTQAPLIEQLERYLLDLFDLCNDTDKELIFNAFKTAFNTDTAKLTGNLPPAIKSIGAKITRAEGAKPAQKKGLIEDALKKNKDGLSRLRNDVIKVTQAGDPATAFPFTPKTAKPASVSRVHFKLRIPKDKKQKLTVDRLIDEATKKGKGATRVVQGAFDAKTGFDMNLICAAQEKAFKKATTEIKDSSYAEAHKNSGRVVGGGVTNLPQRQADYAQKQRIFGQIKTLQVTQSTTDARHKKTNTFEIKAGDSNETVLTTVLIQKVNVTTNEPVEELHIVVNSSDINHLSFRDEDSTKVFDTSTEIGKRQAAVAGTPKLLSETADIIGADSIDVYMDDGVSSNPKNFRAYTEQDLETIIVSAICVFSARRYPIIDKDVWTIAQTYGAKITDSELKRKFDVLAGCLNTPINNENYGPVVAKFRTELAKDTAYEQAATRPMLH